MPIPSSILQLPPLCATLGVSYVVTSPGSRSAALTLAFSAFPDLTTISVRDERVAGYVALGLAQMSMKPVVIVCTSGTAALNLAPAIAEAYFLQVPLLVLTADRPPEWIHQYDGQTIFQENMFGPHVKKAFQWLPEDSEAQSWFARRTFCESIWLSQQAPAGPVHINVPIREPFYPSADAYPLDFPSVHHIQGGICLSQPFPSFLDSWLDQLWESKKPLWVVGQQSDVDLSDALAKLSKYLPVVSDSIGQVSPEHALTFQDAWAPFLTEKHLPSTLISSDKSVLSKPLKVFLRQFPAPEHIHIQASSDWTDPFQTLTEWLNTPPIVIVEAILEKIANQGVPSSWAGYREGFLTLNAHVRDFLSDVAIPPSDASVVRQVMQQIPAHSILHGGNSMAIRYINLFYGLSRGPRVFSNRGTSGIDGCLSTAVGAAMARPDIPHIAVVGDVTFWYDSNALWQTTLPSNLKIILLNNQGGNIFHMIPGPTDQPQFKTFFQTEQHITAEGLAASLQFSYQSDDATRLSDESFDKFWQHDGFLVWEVFTNPDQNKEAMQLWRAALSATLRPAIL